MDVTYFGGIRLVAIDLVGTLVKKPTPSFYTAGSDFLVGHGYDVSPDGFRRIFRKRYLEFSMGNYEDDREFYSAILADLSRQNGSHVDALSEIYNQRCLPFEDATPFLETLSQTYQLMLASNYIAEWARRILLSNHWHTYFREIFVSSDCGFRKPSCQFFRELLKISGASCPSEVLMIGDSVVNDVYGATAAGLKSVLLDRDGASGGHGFFERVLSFSSLHELASTLAPDRIAPLPD